MFDTQDIWLHIFSFMENETIVKQRWCKMINEYVQIYLFILRDKLQISIGKWVLADHQWCYWVFNSHKYMKKIHLDWRLTLQQKQTICRLLSYNFKGNFNHIIDHLDVSKDDMDTTLWYFIRLSHIKPQFLDMTIPVMIYDDIRVYSHMENLDVRIITKICSTKNKEILIGVHDNYSKIFWGTDHVDTSIMSILRNRSSNIECNGETLRYMLNICNLN